MYYVVQNFDIQQNNYQVRPTGNYTTPTVTRSQIVNTILPKISLLQRYGTIKNKSKPKLYCN